MPTEEPRLVEIPENAQPVDFFRALLEASSRSAVYGVFGGKKVELNQAKTLPSDFSLDRDAALLAKQFQNGKLGTSVSPAPQQGASNERSATTH